MGIGSGLVSDSTARDEFSECLLKAEFFTAPEEDFQLIETLRWQQSSGYYLLERHLARLEASADHFGFAFSRAAVEQALLDEGGAARRGRPYGALAA